MSDPGGWFDASVVRGSETAGGLRVPKASGYAPNGDGIDLTPYRNKARHTLHRSAALGDGADHGFVIMAA